MTDSWIQSVHAEFEPYQSRDVLQLLAALQVLPRNAERLLRLEALANAVATITQDDSKPRISRSNFRRMMNQRPIATIESQEDPAEQAFLETVSFIGGSYCLFPGLVEDGPYVIRQMASMLVGNRADFPVPFIRSAVHTMGVGLALSQLVASRVGLPRLARPESVDNQVFVPDATALAELSKAVSVPINEFEEFAATRGFDTGYLEELCTPMGEVAIEEVTIQSGPLDARPVVRIGDHAILAAPGLMSAAIRHAIIRLAISHQILEGFAVAYRETVWRSISRALRLLGHQPARLPLPSIADETPLSDGLFSLDTDKALYVLLATDSGEGYQINETFGHWDAKGLAEALDARQLEAEEFIFGATQGLNELTTLVCLHSFGRSYAIGFGDPLPPLHSPRVIMRPSSLEVISHLESRDQQLLRKYAIASNKAHQRSQFFSWSPLDEFAIYRGNQYSFYLSDGAKPNLVSVASGTQLEIVMEAKERYDIHAVPSFDRGKIIEVAKTIPDVQIPIYSSFDLALAGRRLALLVELSNSLIWIVAPDYDAEPETKDSSEIHFYITDLIAYWLWQFSPSISTYLDGHDTNRVPIIVEIDTVAIKDWRSSPASSDSPESPIAAYEYVADRTIRLSVSPSFMPALASSDNAGERRLMVIVLEALFGLLKNLHDAEGFSNLGIDQIIEKHAPLGRKKKSFVLDVSENPQLSEPGLPSYRAVKMADKSSLLDEIGHHVFSSLNPEPGPIARNDRNSVLHMMVDYLYGRLQKLVSTIEPKGLLHWLIESNEAINRDMTELRLTMPTRMECFSELPGLVESITGNLRGLYEAGQATRFAIEYLSARPPAGLRPMSGSVRDEILALCTEIVIWAYASDLVKYGIVDIEMAYLPSGRVGTNFDELISNPIDQFYPLHSMERIEAAATEFDNFWTTREDPASDRPDQIADLSTAFSAEFGYSLEEFAIVIAECFNLGAEQSSPVKQLSQSDMELQLADRTGYLRATIESILNNLTLEKRTDFLAPQAPFQKEDVYPWRFGRPLSFIMRPLIRTQEGQANTIVWGNLQLLSSVNYIFAMFTSGKYQARAQSLQMRSLLAKFNQERGKKFNRAVADLFVGIEGIIVDSEIKKIGSIRLVENGMDLGDIDVMAISDSLKRLLLIECKDFAVARTPYEISSELKKLFKDEEANSAMSRHMKRADWVRAHLKSVLEHYGADSRGAWRIEPIIVINEEMLSPHLYRTSMPVVSYRILRSSFLDHWLQQ